MPRHVVRVLLLALLVGATVSPMPAHAADAYEVHHVPTVEGAVIRVEIFRDTENDDAGQPVLLTYSPYNVIHGRFPARDRIGSRYVRRGYARAVADVLGTRGSSGCWDYGGANEQQSGVDVVRYLARLPWSNGRVGMIGVSYDGTTANMVAARGDEVPELKAIVSVAAISRWYGYSYGNGARYFLNSEEADDQGFDTPLSFDAGFARTVAPDPASPHFADAAAARAGECGAVAHTLHGYSRNPDYGAFWRERDYRKDAARFRAAALIVHGWRDYNVKQEEGVSLYEAIPVDDPATSEAEGVPFKRLYLSQESHADGSGAAYGPLLDRFLAHTLHGVPNGVDREPPVLTLGRTATGPLQSYRAEAAWPPEGTAPSALWLRGTAGGPFALADAPGTDGTASHWVDAGGVTEEVTLRGTAGESGPGWVSYVSPPLAADVRLAGAARLDAWIRTAAPGSHLTPVLADVAPSGTATTVERGFLNLDYRNGLERAEPAAPGSWVRASLELLPQDYTFRAGHRIALWVQSSNTVWAVPGGPGGMAEIANGPVPGVTPEGSRLVLPLVDPPAGLFTG